MSFYGRMASTASRLLTQYGKPIVLERITSVFNPVTGMDTSRTVSESTTTGVEIPIRDALVDGTRVKVGDRFLIVDASIEPEMSDRLMVGLNPPVVSCAYPMDASLAELQALVPSIDAVPVMTDNFQTATYTLTGAAPVSRWDAVCAPTFVSPGPATVDFSSGVKAFEWEYSMPVAATPAADGTICNAYLGLFYANNFANGLVHVYVESAVSSNLAVTRLIVKRLGTDVSSPIDVPASGRVFVSLDAATGTFSVAHDTLGPIALSDDSYNPATPCIFSANLNEFQSAGLSNAGKDIVASLITNAADMTGLYPAGTTDICGNPLAKDVSESWAIVAIEPISPAGVPVAYRLQVRK